MSGTRPSRALSLRPSPLRRIRSNSAIGRTERTDRGADAPRRAGRALDRAVFVPLYQDIDTKEEGCTWGSLEVTVLTAVVVVLVLVVVWSLVRGPRDHDVELLGAVLRPACSPPSNRPLDRALRATVDRLPAHRLRHRARPRATAARRGRVRRSTASGSCSPRSATPSASCWPRSAWPAPTPPGPRPASTSRRVDLYLPGLPRVVAAGPHPGRRRRRHLGPRPARRRSDPGSW